MCATSLVRPALQFCVGAVALSSARMSRWKYRGVASSAAGRSGQHAQRALLRGVAAAHAAL